MILLPKARFLSKEDYAQKWANVVSSDVFAEATSAAMLHLAFGLPPAQDLNTAAANDLRMQGARLFLVHLASLTDPPAEQKLQPATHNLRHDV